MKLSSYNSYIPYEGKYLFFNAFSQKFLLLETVLYDLLMAARNEANISGLEQIHSTYFHALVSNGFIVEKGENEYEKLRKLRQEIDYDDTTYHLTINPTMNCNFKCWYCYESHIKGSKMDSDSIEKIKYHINNVTKEMPNLKSFHLSWFGGEPLLYFRQIIVPIAKHAKKVLESNGIRFNMSFTTNGYLISEDVVSFLKKGNIGSLQITLDGDKNQHNEVRFINSTKGSYDKIIANIICLAENELNVQVRINYTPENLLSIYSITESFKDLNPEVKKYLNFSFHKVWQTNIESIEEVEKIITAFREAGLSTVSQYANVDTVKNSCYADKKYQATINYNGEVHKCTARDFTSDRTEGVLQDDGSIAWNEKYHQRMDSKFKNSPCNSCRIQPICNGGCSQVAMENAGKDYCVWEDQGISKDEIVLSKFKQMVENKVLREEAAAAKAAAEEAQKAPVTA